VSHDLRAPLRHIGGYVEMLRHESGSALTENGQRFLEVISQAARQMGALIDDLLAFSRMSRVELRRRVIRMDELINEVLQEMKRDTEGRNIEWAIESLPQVFVDRAAMKQVWANLLSNAVKYTRQREPARVKIGCRASETETEFYVRDNGAGFDMRYSDKLFGVFQRLHQADEFEGTGIGLANVRRIVSRHGGRTWAEGKIGEGATFYFTLPNNGKE
jgi:light-regulated signal transduction histidine kinase (bacteriophytochrome)